jgi:hypothetical protein
LLQSALNLKVGCDYALQLREGVASQCENCFGGGFTILVRLRTQPLEQITDPHERRSLDPTNRRNLSFDFDGRRLAVEREDVQLRVARDHRPHHAPA